MNVIDDAALAQAISGVVNPLVDRIEKELLPQVGTLIEGEVSSLHTTIETTLATATGDLGATLKTAVDDVHGIIDRLNGAKLLFVEGGFQLSLPPRP